MENILNLNMIALLPESKKPEESFDSYIRDAEGVECVGVRLPNNLVVVDFDSHGHIGEKINTIYPTFSVKTKRGIHLYYKVPDNIRVSNSNGCNTISGVPVDYKTGFNGKKALAVIKSDGKMREVINNEGYQHVNELPELPPVLYPLIKSKEPLVELAEGDSRNSLLFKHLLTSLEQYKSLRTNDKEQVKILDFINEEVFTESLSAKETIALHKSVLKTLDEKRGEMSDIFDDKGNVVMAELAPWVIREFDVKVYGGFLWFYHEDKYISDNRMLQRKIAEKLFLRANQDAELLHQLHKLAPKIEQNTYFPVKVKNGFVISNDEVIKIDKLFTPYNLNANYDPDAYNADVDNALNTICNNNPQLRLLIEEILGHILMTHSFPHKVIFFVGEKGSNGKSTLLEMITNWLGENVINLALESFNDNTSIAQLRGKLANLGDDVDAQYMERSKNFKTLASGNTISVRTVYAQETVTLKSCASLLFTANEMPVFKDKTGGIARRLVIFPCEARITKADLSIDKKLSTESARSYITNLAIQGMKRIAQNGGRFSENEEIEDLKNKYLTENDSVLSFLYENDVHNMSTIIAYELYEDFCEIEGYKPVSKNKMSRRMKTMDYDIIVKKIDGKTVKQYIKVE